MANITVSADGVDQKFALESPTVTLGRGLESDIRLKDIKASRRHCQIVKTPQGYQCLDLSSGNGTFINGVQIKQQLLSEGDKIQIGTTTITFHDANGAKATASVKPVTAAAPAAKPTTARAATGKTATAALPAAPTKKITAKIDVVKPSTASASKPGTQAIAKTGTQAMSKTTGSVKKTTQRMGATTRSAKATATQKFHAEGRKKKTSPVAVVIGVIIALFVVGVGCIFFVGGDDTEFIKDQLEALTKQGADLDQKGQIDAAIEKYAAALKLVQGKDKFKTREVDLKGIIKEMNDRKGDLAAANSKFAEFKGKFEKATDEDAQKLWREGKDMYAHYEQASVSFLPQLKEILEKLDNMARTKRATEKKMEFQTVRQEISDQCKLSQARQALFGEAIKKWKEYIDKKPSEDARNKAENEISTITRRANEEAVRLGKATDRAIEESKKAPMLEDLKTQKPRFEGTPSAAEIDKLIQKLEEK